MISTLLLLAVLAFGLYFLLNSKRKKYNLPPGPWNLPIFGAIFSMGTFPHITFEKWARKYGPLIYAKFGLTDVLIIDDPKLIREAFNEPVFSGRGDNKVFQLLSEGRHGVINTDGSEWTEQRRFTLRTLRDFGFGKKSLENFIMEEVNDFLKWMKEREGLPTVVGRRFALATVNSLWTIIAGERHEQDDPIISEIGDKANRLLVKLADLSGPAMVFPNLIPILPKSVMKSWYAALEAVHPFLKIFKDAVQNHINNPADEKSPRDFIDVYINEVKKTTDPSSSFYKDKGSKSMLAVCSDLYGAGQATTSNLLTWTVLYLVRFPEAQKKLQNELDEVIGRNRVPSLADRPNLPYTEALTNEISRWSSILPIGVFHSAMEDTVFHGYDIKKDTLIIPNLYSVHHSKKIWGDPEAFRPERFLDDGKKVGKTDNLMLFSVGKRQCLGESFARDNYFLFLTNIFHRFEIKMDPANPPPSLDSTPAFVREAQEFYAIIKERA